MRILFLHHFPLIAGRGGACLIAWRRLLAEAGHESRVVVACGQANDEPGVSTVTCRRGDTTADLPFDLPWFSSCQQAASLGTFNALSNAQLSDYRQKLRERIDSQIAEFDPHVIHAQHIWVQGQLALESGVPYLLNAWGTELTDAAADDRYYALAEQAAENAGRILVRDATLAERVAGSFPELADRIEIMAAAIEPTESLASRESRLIAAELLVSLYRAIYEERFGVRPV